MPGLQRSGSLHSLVLFLGFPVLVLQTAAPAGAHPHVWVEASAEIVFSEHGRIAAIRHKWRFDELYSTMAIQGQDANGDGTWSREELASLAELNVTTLSDYGFFTFLDTEMVKATFKDAADYWLTYEDGRLTLNFTLPLEIPFDPMSEGVEFTVYDESYFVSFTFTSIDAVRLTGDRAPDCATELNTPDEARQAAQTDKPEDYWANFGMGAMFAQTVHIRCEQTR